MGTRLSELGMCFQGVIPSVIATCDAKGEPNVTYLSQVFYIGEQHVALSCQFFNKTKRNILENPLATVIVYDPLSFEAYRIVMRFLREEKHGELFDTMALRIEVIASHTGMSGVFRLLSSDVFEVLSVEPLEGYLISEEVPRLDAPPPVDGPLTELRGLQSISERIAAAVDLESLLGDTLATLDELFHFSHAMVLVLEPDGERLVAIANRGYGERGIGAEVLLGEGLIGTVARRRRMLRLSGVGAELRYGRAIRNRVQEFEGLARLAPEIPLPGLPDAQAQLVLPLLARDALIGVLAVESKNPLCFDEWDEAFLQIVGSQIATGIERMSAAVDELDAAPSARTERLRRERNGAVPKRNFVDYKNDDCIFVDGEYLVRNVPAKILWKVLNQNRSENRSEFTNRELRLDPTLGLPALKDNLESRLILLRKRLAEKCPDVRLVPTGRGRFALELSSLPVLVERESG
jgi:hypothetical protein